MFNEEIILCNTQLNISKRIDDDISHRISCDRIASIRSQTRGHAIFIGAHNIKMYPTICHASMADKKMMGHLLILVYQPISTRW